jgi:hypothetical protein
MKIKNNTNMNEGDGNHKQDEHKKGNDAEKQD